MAHLQFSHVVISAATANFQRPSGAYPYVTALRLDPPSGRVVKSLQLSDTTNSTSSIFLNGSEGHLLKWRKVEIGSRMALGSTLKVHSSLNYLNDAAKISVDSFVKSGMAIGLGTGCASSMAIAYIGEKLRNGLLRDLICVPISSASAAAAALEGIPLQPFEEHSKLDIVFDDANTVQQGTLFAIIGRKEAAGRQSIFKEKAIMKAAKEVVFIIDEKQFVDKLEGAVPVLIRPENWPEVAEEIDDVFLGDVEIWRRPSSGEARPLGDDNPLVTPEGYFVLDVVFTTPVTAGNLPMSCQTIRLCNSPSEVAEKLETIPGVVGHGLVIDVASAVVVASPAGTRIRIALFQASPMSTE